MKSLLNILKRIFGFVSNKVESSIEKNTSETDRILAYRNKLDEVLVDINDSLLKVKQSKVASESVVQKLDENINDRKRLYKAASDEQTKDRLARLIQVDAKTHAIRQAEVEKLQERHAALSSQKENVKAKFEQASSDYRYALELEKLGDLESNAILTDYSDAAMEKTLSEIEMQEIKNGSSVGGDIQSLEISEFRKQLDSE